MKKTSTAPRNGRVVKKKQSKRKQKSHRELREAGAGVQKCIKATQVSLGFERGHPMVWDFFRKKSVLVISYNTVTSKHRMKFLGVGQRVVVCVPKAQGGSGVVGIGKVTGPATLFLKGGKPIPDVIGTAYRAHMRMIYAHESNKPVKSARCWNKQFKQHQLSTSSWKMTPWDYAQSKGWGLKGAKVQLDPNNRMEHIPIQWEQTAAFDNGVSKVDWCSLGLQNFALSSLNSVTPRKLTEPHWAVLRKCLRHASSKSSVATSVLQPASSKVPKAKSISKRAPQSKSVDALLASIGLTKYAPKLRAEEVSDSETLKLLTDEDLQTIGFPLGPRRKLQAAVGCRRRDPEHV